MRYCKFATVSMTKKISMLIVTSSLLALALIHIHTVSAQTINEGSEVITSQPQIDPSIYNLPLDFTQANDILVQDSQTTVTITHNYSDSTAPYPDNQVIYNSVIVQGSCLLSINLQSGSSDGTCSNWIAYPLSEWSEKQYGNIIVLTPKLVIL